MGHGVKWQDADRIGQTSQQDTNLNLNLNLEQQQQEAAH